MCARASSSSCCCSFSVSHRFQCLRCVINDGEIFENTVLMYAHRSYWSTLPNSDGNVVCSDIPNTFQVLNNSLIERERFYVNDSLVLTLVLPLLPRLLLLLLLCIGVRHVHHSLPMYPTQTHRQCMQRIFKFKRINSQCAANRSNSHILKHSAHTHIRAIWFAFCLWATHFLAHSIHLLLHCCLSKQTYVKHENILIEMKNVDSRKRGVFIGCKSRANQIKLWIIELFFSPCDFRFLVLWLHVVVFYSILHSSDYWHNLFVKWNESSVWWGLFFCHRQMLADICGIYITYESHALNDDQAHWMMLSTLCVANFSVNRNERREQQQTANKQCPCQIETTIDDVPAIELNQAQCRSLRALIDERSLKLG